MSAQNNLSSKLFHGTHAKLKPGDIILPHGKLKEGTSNFGETSKAHLAYATPDLEDAKYFAFHAATQDEDSVKTAHVYQVEPVGKVKMKNMYPRYKKNVPRLQAVSQEGFKVKAKVASKRPKKGQTVETMTSKDFWK